MIGGAFNRLARISRGTVERVHGDAVVVHPVDRPGGPNGRRAPSVDRAPFETVLCFYQDSMPIRDIQLMPDRGRMMHRSPALSGSLRLSPTIPLRTGDMIHRTADGQWFEVSTIDPDGNGQAMVTMALAQGLQDA